jgi:metallo-beta-lactamase family protein
MSLKVKFIGAVGTVTGSCSLLHYERTDSYYLVDCGLYQGFPGDSERNQRKFPFEPKRLSAVLLTHAHIDHCGLLPRLVAEGFCGKVICTRATRQFTLDTLADSVRLTGLYSNASVAALGRHFFCPDEADDFTFGHFYPLDTDLFYSFLRTAHIVGSVAVGLRFNVTPEKHRTVLFSGDIGPCADGVAFGGLQRERHNPNPQTEYIIAESTYGGRSRDPDTGLFQNRIQALATTLRAALTRGPRPVIIFPAYTLNRTQELVAELHYVLCRQNKIEVVAPSAERPTVIVDSPLALKHTKTMAQEFRRVQPNGKRLFLNEKSPLFAGLESNQIDALLDAWFQTTLPGKDGWTLHYGEKDARTVSGPVILISGSGNCLGGPVVKHLERHLAEPGTTVVFTGYQPTGSPGDWLKRPQPERKREKLRLGDVELSADSVKATVSDLSTYFSGHADENGLVEFILHDDTGKATHPLTVFLNHGDGEARAMLKVRLESVAQSGDTRWRKLAQVFTPAAGKGWFDFGTGDWLPTEYGVAYAEQTKELLSMLREILDNQQEILTLLRASAPCSTHPPPARLGLLNLE